MDLPCESVDRAVSRLAARQHGVVHLEQLNACGMTETMRRDRLGHGRLYRVHPRVYAVGHASLSFEGRVRALLLAAGNDAFVSGMAALYLRGVSTRTPATIDVVVRRHTRPLRGSRIIQSRGAHEDEFERRGDILVATHARALLDVAARTPILRLNRLIYECAYQDLGAPLDIDRMLERYPRRQGRRRLDVANARHRAGSAGARSAFEEIVIARMRDAGVPPFRVNTHVGVREGSIEVDVHWPEDRLVVEIDGVPHAREESRRRDASRAQKLRAAGWSVLHVRHGSVDRDIRRVVKRVTIAQGR